MYKIIEKTGLTIGKIGEIIGRMCETIAKILVINHALEPTIDLASAPDLDMIKV